METNVFSTDRITGLFQDLEARKSILTTCTTLYKDLCSHFQTLNQTLATKSKDLDSRIVAFDLQTKLALESLELRETSIPNLESDMATRINQTRVSVVSDTQNGTQDNDKEVEFSIGLRSYCRNMDSDGLMKFLLLKRKESVALRSEVVLAVNEAVDTERLMVDSLDGFLKAKFGKGGVADRRWACGVLMHAVFPLSDLASGKRKISNNMVERAYKVAERWMNVMNGGDIGVGPGEAAMFLQFICGFGLKGRFEEEFLIGLVVEHAARRDMAKIAVLLGIKEKMKDIIEDLVKNGKEIEAVYFAFESGLTEQFNPASLLKSYLSTSKKCVNALLKNNRNSAATDQANAMELFSCKAIIKCVDDYELESKFSTESLRRRVAQLEKAKTDKKRGSVSKPSNKRAHGNRDSIGSSGFRTSKSSRYSNFSSSFGNRKPPQPPQAPAPGYPSGYSYSSQTYPSLQGYEGSSTVQYVPTHNQNPGQLTQQYTYISQDQGVDSRNNGSDVATANYAYNYAAYDYTNALPSNPPAYHL